MMSTESDFYKTILDGLYDGVYFVDPERRITFWNHGAERITGYKANQVMGKRCADNMLMHVDDKGRQLCLEGCPLTASMADGCIHEAQVFVHHISGYRLPVMVRVAPLVGQDGQVIGAVETFTDNSQMIAALKKVDELTDVAMKDPLTELGNRRFLETMIDLRLLESRLTKPADGFLFVDIDHFKHINDTYGHETGDLVLKMVADTLKLNLRPSDTVVRWGGEEFIIIIQVVTQPVLLELANRLRALVQQSILDRNLQHISVTISVGATLVRDNDSLETLVERAAGLMYQSKATGRNRVTYR
jgi:diguanylate cyclase (GGDEF)-like protein/PAS domain S-box-containing protein